MERGKKPKNQNYIKTAKTQSSTSAHVRAKEILFTPLTKYKTGQNK